MLEPVPVWSVPPTVTPHVTPDVGIPDWSKVTLYDAGLTVRVSPLAPQTELMAVLFESPW
jgi:hypothetical protein